MSDQPSGDDVAAVQKCEQAYNKIRDELSKTIVGQEEVVEQALVAMFARGHALLEGVPGLAKTLLVSSLAQALQLTFKRVQFTPDLMPSDVTGTDVIQENLETGARQYTFLPGPLFANMVLADEINRTPPKTQAAMLEAMQERQVSAGGTTHQLPRPFFVLATQNPLEQEGTYPLPEAQLDRFLLHIKVGYPSARDEWEIARRVTGGQSGRRQHPVQRATPPVVGPLGREVAEVHQQRAGRGHDVHPLPRRREHLQAGHLVGVEHGAHAVVGVLANAPPVGRIGRVRWIAEDAEQHRGVGCEPGGEPVGAHSKGGGHGCQHPLPE